MIKPRGVFVGCVQLEIGNCWGKSLADYIEACYLSYGTHGVDDECCW